MLLLLLGFCERWGIGTQLARGQQAASSTASSAGTDGLLLEFPRTWLLGAPDAATATLARLLSENEEVQVHSSASVACRAVAPSDDNAREQLAAAAARTQPRGRAVVAACAQLWVAGVHSAIAFLKDVQATARDNGQEPAAAIKAILVVRDEPQHAYDAWNTFCWPGVDEDCPADMPALRRTHDRSPERFHQLLSDPSQAAMFPPLNTSLKAQYSLYRSAFGERLLVLSAHTLLDRPWETLFRVESFLGLHHSEYSQQALDDAEAAAGGLARTGFDGGSLLQEQHREDLLLWRPAEWPQLLGASSDSNGGGGTGGEGQGGGGSSGEEGGSVGGPGVAEGSRGAGGPATLHTPMLADSAQVLQARWLDDCHHLADKAHLLLLSCPPDDHSNKEAALRAAKPVLQRRGKAFNAAKLIGLLRAKRRELVRGANQYLQQLGVRNVTLSLKGTRDGEAMALGLGAAGAAAGGGEGGEGIGQPRPQHHRHHSTQQQQQPQERDGQEVQQSSGDEQGNHGGELGASDQQQVEGQQGRGEVPTADQQQQAGTQQQADEGQGQQQQQGSEEGGSQRRRWLRRLR